MVISGMFLGTADQRSPIKLRGRKLGGWSAGLYFFTPIREIKSAPYLTIGPNPIRDRFRGGRNQCPPGAKIDHLRRGKIPEPVHWPGRG